MTKQEKLLERIEHISNKEPFREVNFNDDYEVGYLAGWTAVTEYLTTILELYYNEQDK